MAVTNLISNLTVNSAGLNYIMFRVQETRNFAERW
jgi:hypothetical protein